jgi:protein disulfide-isomerase
MKRIIIVATLMLTLLVFISCHAEKESSDNPVSTGELKWLINFEEAMEVAEENDLPIFVNFTGSDWCGWCKRLQSEVFSQTEFINYANENLVLLKLDFPKYIQQTEETKKYNGDLATRFGIRGFPTILLLNSQGEEIKRTGYQPGGAEAYIKHIETLLSS